jgi:hypothetical protein
MGVMDCAARRVGDGAGAVDASTKSPTVGIAKPHGFRTESIEKRTDLD